jgi:hypothetical protein
MEHSGVTNISLPTLKWQSKSPAIDMIRPTCTVHKNAAFSQMIDSLCKTAKTGLCRFYKHDSTEMPYSTTLNPHNEWKSHGVSIRYAAISQIGIAGWLKTHPKDRAHLPNLWSKIADNYHKIKDIGDLALALWAGVVSEEDRCELFAKALSTSWQSQANLCNAVELAWIVQAGTAALSKRNALAPYIEPVLNEARTRLVSLFRPQQNLFQRHNRSGFKEIISRRIACFADQVYPILALSNYGLLFNDKQSVELAAKTTEQICRLQGPLGQWWWHYDTANGKVCEGYPVFSVHQDSMAPMAIMASDRVTSRNHTKEIEAGLRWSFGNNELNQNLLLAEHGIIWRDIEKREPAKVSRAFRALLCVSGLRSLHSLADKCFIGFCINYECRPYHLGWILYAWANHLPES